MRWTVAFSVAVASLSLGGAALADCPRMRPTDEGGYQGYAFGDAGVASYATDAGNVRVWYATEGPHAPSSPGDAEVVGRVLDDAIDGFVAMDYRRALGDGDYETCASNGGDGRIDVYLMDFAGASDGLATTEQCRGKKVRACSGFILIDNDFAEGGYADFEEGVKTVVPHEYFHLVQNAYDADVERFFAEGTAQWACKALSPKLMDLERFLPAYFEDTDRSLDAPPAGVTAAFLYGSAIWPVFLSEHLDAAVVREVFEELGKAGGTVAEGSERVLERRGTSLADAFTTFATWNAATGTRAGKGGYTHAASYPMVTVATLPSEEGSTVEGITSGLASYAYRNAGARRTLALETDAARNAGRFVPLDGERALLDEAVALPAEVDGDGLIVIAGTTALKTDGPFALRVDPPPEDPAPSRAPDAEGSCSAAPHPVRGASLGLLCLAFALTFARHLARNQHHRG